MQLLDIAGGAGLDDGLVTLVVGMLPTARICGASIASTTSAVRTPRFCWMRGLTVTWLPSALLPSAYTGTSIMSMNGDLAGRSNLLPGTIGSW